MNETHNHPPAEESLLLSTEPPTTTRVTIDLWDYRALLEAQHRERLIAAAWQRGESMLDTCRVVYGLPNAGISG